MDGVKHGIDACRRDHNCASLDTWEDIELAGFRLIDCVELKVDVKKKCRFVALSYVWGGWKVQDNPSPANIPRTIQDAMAATQMLEFRYLWVDAYCIEQNCEEHLEQQLN
ncbi:hypothetical protein BDV96DRAFT_581855 [Lophiotrema nucula]|uniref:Heterokaryon incompatibility domain-containing protein n=1 Tax=Lophiotrema nucula TaxID=690887 RepID=A0A6A5YXJ8_9PLEO|nr:hypothetical protein BDV96DRAFT_581855 [Lophiotrema nucula]